MTNDFEVHSIGTTTEIRLSRALAREIDQVTQSYGQVVPHGVYKAFLELKKHYDWQIENGML